MQYSFEGQAIACFADDVKQPSVTWSEQTLICRVPSARNYVSLNFDFPHHLRAYWTPDHFFVFCFDTEPLPAENIHVKFLHDKGGRGVLLEEYYSQGQPPPYVFREKIPQKGALWIDVIFSPPQFTSFQLSNVKLEMRELFWL